MENDNGNLRHECREQHWVKSTDDARQKVEAWMQGYNRQRPQSSLKDAALEEYLQK